jgi:hypothetical protein
MMVSYYFCSNSSYLAGIIFRLPLVNFKINTIKMGKRCH